MKKIVNIIDQSQCMHRFAHSLKGENDCYLCGIKMTDLEMMRWVDSREEQLRGFSKFNECISFGGNFDNRTV